MARMESLRNNGEGERCGFFEVKEGRNIDFSVNFNTKSQFK